MKAYHLFFFLVGFMLFAVVVVDNDGPIGQTLALQKDFDVDWHLFTMPQRIEMYIAQEWPKPYSAYKPPTDHTGKNYVEPNLTKPHYIFAYSKRV